MADTQSVKDIADDLWEAAAKLRANPERPVDEPLAAWLAKTFEVFHEQVTMEQPECPACGDGCYDDHGDVRVHEGGCGGVLLEVGSDRCRCFAEALAVARVINGTTPQEVGNRG